MYECSKCKKPVIVMANGSIIRECEHADSPVILQLRAHATGKSSTGNK